MKRQPDSLRYPVEVNDQRVKSRCFFLTIFFDVQTNFGPKYYSNGSCKLKHIITIRIAVMVQNYDYGLQEMYGMTISISKGT